MNSANERFTIINESIIPLKCGFPLAGHVKISLGIGRDKLPSAMSFLKSRNSSPLIFQTLFQYGAIFISTPLCPAQ